MRHSIAIVDTIWEGHHPTYFKIFCKIAIEHGCKVFALSPAVSEMSEWKTKKNYTSEQIEILSFHETPSVELPVHFMASLLTTYKRWHAVSISLKDINPDFVFFPWLDNFLNVLLFPCIHKLLFSFSWAGIYFHPTYLRVKTANRFRQKIRETTAKVFNSKQCRGIAVLDEGISTTLQIIIGNKIVTVLPDFADDSVPDLNYPIVKKLLNKAKKRKIVILTGVLAKRKGFFTLLKAASNISSENFFFVFAGKLDRTTFSKSELIIIDGLLAEPPDNCFFFYQKIPEETQFNSLFAVSDVVFACYDNFPHSSNMITKAALFKKPIIVSKRFCMGERVRKFGLGETINEGDSEGCINAIFKLTHHNNMIDDVNFEKYLSVHSNQIFTNNFLKLSSLMKFKN